MTLRDEPLTIVADRWTPDGGGRERYAADLIAHLESEGRAIDRAQPRGMAAIRSRRILALTPVRAATHYQLHGGVLASAFDAERRSMQSSVRRALFQPALRFNQRRQRLMDEEARVIEGHAALMVFSTATARELVETRGVARTRIVLSRPGVDLRRFHPPARRTRAACRLAFVGHHFALKGLRAAILTLARLRRGGVAASLAVAGDGPSVAFHRIAAREGVADTIRFAGPLDQDGVADLLRSSDALIHPTFYDPFPRVAVEALASGCPVITTACCGASEILTPGRDGFVVPDPRDVDGLAEAVSHLADPDRRACLQRAAAELGGQFDQAQHFRSASGWLFEDCAE